MHECFRLFGFRGQDEAKEEGVESSSQRLALEALLEAPTTKSQIGRSVGSRRAYGESSGELSLGGPFRSAPALPQQPSMAQSEFVRTRSAARAPTIVSEGT